MNNGENQFFIYLSSLSTQFPDNKQNNFKIQIPRQKELNKQFYVGLSQINFPNNTLTLPLKAHRKIYWTCSDEKLKLTFTIPNKSYKNPQHLIESINLVLRREIPNKYINKKSNICYIKYNSKYNRATIKNTHFINQKIAFNIEIANLLGIKTEEWLNAEDPVFTPTYHIPTADFKVHTNIINHEHVGENMEPLLRQIITDSDKKYVSLNFDPIYYKKIKARTISIIHTKLIGENGVPVEFENRGGIGLYLHFISDELLFNLKKTKFK